MKLWEKRFGNEWLKRFHKKQLSTTRHSVRRKKKWLKAKNRSVVHRVVAPAHIDMYKPQKAKLMMLFFDDIERYASECVTRSIPLQICFRNTTFITAAAALLLLAKIENIKTINPSIVFRVIRPPAQAPRSKGSYGPRENTVDSVLNRIGVYELLIGNKHAMREAANVKCWQVARGNSVLSQEAGLLLKEVGKDLNLNLRALYGPLVEAMSNAVEHAYPNDNDRKWWMFAGIMPDRANLTVLICDLGVGIPSTLEKTQKPSFLKNLQKICDFSLNGDDTYIKAALEVKKTRTKLGYRGKGGNDLKSAITSIKGSNLLVLSNKGYYKYKNNGVQSPEFLTTFSSSIGGTLVQWSIPLPNNGVN